MFARGCTFIEAVCVHDAEEDFYASIGLRRNPGRVVYYLDARPYMTAATDDRDMAEMETQPGGSST